MKRYLGDGVYVQTMAGSLVLTTENGIRTTNTIWLEPEVYAALVEYVKGGERETHKEAEGNHTPVVTDGSTGADR